MLKQCTLTIALILLISTSALAAPAPGIGGLKGGGDQQVHCVVTDLNEPQGDCPQPVCKVVLCTNGICAAPVKRNCEDGIICTEDKCNKDTDECQHTLNDALCDDNNACTDDSCDFILGCQNIDPNPCVTPIEAGLCAEFECNTDTGNCEEIPQEVVGQTACGDATDDNDELCLTFDGYAEDQGNGGGGEQSGDSDECTPYCQVNAACSGNEEDPECPKKTGAKNDTIEECAVKTDPVQIYSGAFSYDRSDLALDGSNFQLILNRHYTSSGASTVHPGVFGPGWDNSFDRRVELLDDSSLMLYEGDGSPDVYQPYISAGGKICYQSSSSTTNICREAGDLYFTMRHNGGEVWKFYAGLTISPPGAFGKLYSMTDQFGHTVTFNYLTGEDLGLTSQEAATDPRVGQLKNIIDPDGHTVLEFPEYFVVSGPLSSSARLGLVVSIDGRSVQYIYYGMGDGPPAGEYGRYGTLAQVNYLPGLRNADGQYVAVSESYEYDGLKIEAELADNLRHIIDATGFVTVENIYGSDIFDYDRVISQTIFARDANGILNEYTYEYFNEYLSVDDPEAYHYGVVQRVIIKDPQENISYMYFDEKSNLGLKREFNIRASSAQLPPEGPPGDTLRPDEPNFYETSYIYNKRGYLTSQYFPGDYAMQLTYAPDTFDANGNGVIDPNEWADPHTLANVLKDQTCVNLTSTGLCDDVNESDKLVNTISYEPPAPTMPQFFDLVSEVTDAKNNVSSFTYTPFGKIKTKTEPVSPGLNIVTEYFYNNNGKIDIVCGPRYSDTEPCSGKITQFVYYETDPDDIRSGRIKEIIKDPDGLAITEVFDNYDMLGNPTRVIDANGNILENEFNELGFLIRTFSPMGVAQDVSVKYKTEMYYDPLGNIVRIEIENRDETGNLVASNPTYTMIMEYGSVGDISGLLLRSCTEVNPYDSEIFTRELDNGTAVPTCNPSLVSQAFMDAFVVLENAYDGRGNQILVRKGEATNGMQPNNEVMKTYDTKDMLYKSIMAPNSPNPIATVFSYDPMGRTTRVDSGCLEGTPSCIKSVYSHYDDFGRIEKMDDSMGNWSLFDHDKLGNLIRTQIFGAKHDYSPGLDDITILQDFELFYDASNRVITSEKQFLNGAGVPVLDENDNPIVIVSHITYTADGTIKTAEDAAGSISTNIYDAVGRLKEEENTVGDKVLYQYDQNSNITLTTTLEYDPEGVVTEFTVESTYDSLNRLVHILKDGLAHNDIRYNSMDNPVLMYDARRGTGALGNKTRIEYDGLDRVLSTTRYMTDTGDGSGTIIIGDSVITQKAWDDNSRLVSHTDPNDNVTNYEHDYFNRLTKTTMADQTIHEILEYDFWSNPIKTKDANGTIIHLSYNKLNRLVGRNVIQDSDYGPGVSHQISNEDYVYNGLGELVVAVDDKSRVERQYNSLGGVISEILTYKHENGNVVANTTYQSDALGRVKEIVYPNGTEMVLEYDDGSRLSTVTEFPNGQPGPSVELASYDYVANRVLLRTQPGDVEQQNEYDEMGRLKKIEYIDTTPQANQTLFSFNYEWDLNGNKTKRTNNLTGEEESFEYDSLSRLKKSIHDGSDWHDYQFDAAGNRISVDSEAYTMNAGADTSMNQYSATPFSSLYNYDSNGNLLGTNDLSMITNIRNQVSDVTVSGDEWTYVYDLLGRRIAKEGPNGNTFFVYAGNHVIEEWATDGVNSTLLSFYAHGRSTDEVLMAKRDAIGNDGVFETYNYANDDLSSILGLFNTEGQLLESYKYDDYGLPSFIDAAGNILTGSSFSNPYLFTGRRYDDETKLFYYRARYMDPIIGRFISRDQIGIWGDDKNLGVGNQYVGNNPQSFNDPSGNCGDGASRHHITDSFKETTRKMTEARGPITLPEITLDNSNSNRISIDSTNPMPRGKYTGVPQDTLKTPGVKDIAISVARLTAVATALAEAYYRAIGDNAMVEALNSNYADSLVDIAQEGEGGKNAELLIEIATSVTGAKLITVCSKRLKNAERLADTATNAKSFNDAVTRTAGRHTKMNVEAAKAADELVKKNGGDRVVKALKPLETSIGGRTKTRIALNENGVLKATGRTADKACQPTHAIVEVSAKMSYTRRPPDNFKLFYENVQYHTNAILNSKQGETLLKILEYLERVTL